VGERYSKTLKKSPNHSFLDKSAQRYCRLLFPAICVVASVCSVRSSCYSVLVWFAFEIRGGSFDPVDVRVIVIDMQQFFAATTAKNVATRSNQWMDIACIDSVICTARRLKSQH
jgi:hypothetical protein